MTAPVLWKPLERKCFKATLLKRHLRQTVISLKFWIILSAKRTLSATQSHTSFTNTKDENHFLSRCWRFHGRQTALTRSWLLPTWLCEDAVEDVTEAWPLVFPPRLTSARCLSCSQGGSSSCPPWSRIDQLRCPLGGGSCQKECATLEVEDELACGCGCRLDPSSCRY